MIKIPGTLLCPVSYFPSALILVVRACKWHTWQAWIIINKWCALTAVPQMNGFTHREATGAPSFKETKPRMWVCKGDSQQVQITLSLFVCVQRLASCNLSERWKDHTAPQNGKYQTFPFGSCRDLYSITTIDPEAAYPNTLICSSELHLKIGKKLK